MPNVVAIAVTGVCQHLTQWQTPISWKSLRENLATNNIIVYAQKSDFNFG